MNKAKTLSNFIVIVGDDEAAKLFGVSKRTAQAWRLGQRSPWRTQARLIVDKTAKHPAGPVTFEGIYK